MATKREMTRKGPKWPPNSRWPSKTRWPPKNKKTNTNDTCFKGFWGQEIR